MIRSLAIAAALTLTAAAAPALAQTPAPAAQPAAKFTVDTPMAEISADPQAKVVLGDFFEKRRIAAGAPAMTPEESAGLAEMIGGLSPRQLAEFPQANLDDAALAELDALLRAVPAHANH